MGGSCASCSSSADKDHLNMYESAIHNGEQKLGWHKAHTFDLISAFKKVSKNNLINENALRLALSTVGLSTQNIKNSLTVQGRFFRKLQEITNKDSKFHERDL